MSELNIKIRKLQDNGSTFRATPESLYMGGVGSAKVDTLCFDVPEEWKGCAITLHVQRLSGTLPDPQLLDEKNRAVVDQRWTKEKQGLWMLMAVGADGYTAMTKPGRYTCYETIDRDSTTETITPSVYEQFVALVKKETAEANRAAKNAAASAEIAKNFESTITETGEQVQREITATADQTQKDLTATADQTKQAIEEKARAALASIPEDYTALSESVGQLKEDLTKLDDILKLKETETEYNDKVKGTTISTANRWFLNGFAYGILKSVFLRFKTGLSGKIEVWEKVGNTLNLIHAMSVSCETTYTWKSFELNIKSNYPMMVSVIGDDGYTFYQTTDTSKTFNGYYIPDLTSNNLTFSELRTFTGLCVIGYMTYQTDYINRPIIIAAQNGNGDFTNIAEAVNHAKDGDTILVYPGIYTEPIEAWGKTLNIIGVDKNSCIITNDTANYSTPAVEIDSGRLANFTIISNGAKPTCDVSDVDNYMRDYTIHVDHIHAEGKTLIIEDCIIRNNHRTALGMGCYADNTIIVRNCDIWADVPPSNIQNPLWNKRGALYFHNRQNSDYFSNITGQKMRFINNTIYCEDIIAVYIGDTWQSDYDSKGYVNEMEVEFINNMICAKNTDGTYRISSNGIATPTAFTQDSCIGGTGFTDHIKLSSISYGNNVTYLNA